MWALCTGAWLATATSRERAMVTYALKLTTLSARLEDSDVESLRQAGLADEGVRWLVQVVAYFNYVNRHVEGLGLELEPGHPGGPFADAALAERSAP